MINPLFTHAFNEEGFNEFIQELIPSLSLSKKRAEKRTGFKSIEQIAEASENNLDLVVFLAKPNLSLNARVEITKSTYSVLKNHARSNALVVYISDDSPEWRLSLITTKVSRTKDGVKESVSNPRRFSYVLGPGAKVATPSKMLRGDVVSIQDLESQFSLAIVSKEFFTRIATIYSKLVGGTRGEGKKATHFKRLLELGNADDSVNANFAIRLIGRLVFCWFLKQKKGLSNIPLIPTDLLSVTAVNNIGDYYHSVCAPLFFEVLNKPQNSRPYFFSHSELFDKVPFLNGGLFQDHAEDNHKFNRVAGISERRGVVKIPDIWFSELFQIFEEYNFTIDENTSIDTELSIDPEMLGRIFENLLAEVNPETGASARKSTGSFYTPREIVDFMVEESLVAHLKNKTKISEEKIRALSSYDLEDDVSHPIETQERKLLVEAIHDTTVLDPACGSGAFPIGVLQRMVHVLEVLDPDCSIYLNKLPPELRRHFQKNNLTYVRKLGIIRECIHGVDIQPIAIDISRLRCFLTLVVDQQVDDGAPNRGIEPLPNLDFKFVCANTLIPPPVHEGPLFGDEFAIALGELIDEYFAPVDQLHKLETARKLQQLISDKTKKELESILKSYSYVKDEKLKKVLAQKNEKTNAERMRINELWGSYENIFQNKPVGFFDTRYFFPIVFRKGGFDIVIANPPYIGHKGGLKHFFKEIKSSPLGRRFNNERMDLFYYFFHLSLDLSTENGIVSFITTNYFLTADSAKKLRNDFKDRTHILKLVNFQELKIFDSALGQHSILTFLQKGINNDSKCSTYLTHRVGLASQEILKNILDGNDKQTVYNKVNQNELYDGSNNYIRIIGATNKKQLIINDILLKISSQGLVLLNLCNIGQGIVSGLDKISQKHIRKDPLLQNSLGSGVYVINDHEKNKIGQSPLIKPWFKNSDIHKYYVNEKNDKWLIHTHSNVILDDYPNIKEHLQKYKNIINLRNFDSGELSKAKKIGAWWALSSSRKEFDFTQPKIVSPQRSNTNMFAYTEKEWFASADVYFITSRIEKCSLKYILAILNSKLYYLWLYQKGKRKGEMLELYLTPLSEIPVKSISEPNQKPFTEVVDKILAITKTRDYLENPAKKEEVKKYEKQIDQLVYKLYGLTPEEIKIVESK